MSKTIFLKKTPAHSYHKFPKGNHNCIDFISYTKSGNTNYLFIQFDFIENENTITKYISFPQFETQFLSKKEKFKFKQGYEVKMYLCFEHFSKYEKFVDTKVPTLDFPDFEIQLNCFPLLSP